LTVNLLISEMTGGFVLPMENPLSLLRMNRYSRRSWPWKTRLVQRRFFARPITVLAALSLICSVQGATKTWNNNGTDFNTSGNWTGGLPGTADIATFTGAASVQPNLSANISISGLNFSSNSSNGYDLTSSSTSIKLTLLSTATGATGAINSGNTTGSNIIDAPIVLGAAASATQTFTQSSAGTLVIKGAISSANAITQLTLAGNGGTYTFSGANSYSGDTVVNSGVTLNINSATAISSGALATGTGSFTIDNTSNTAITLTNNNAINLNGGSLTFTGTKDLSFGSGAVTMTGATNRTITVSNSGATLTVGSVGDSGGGRALNKSGAGTLVISGSSTYSGATNILGGTLSVSALANTGTNSTITLDASSSVLKYTGTGETTAKVISITGSAGTRTIDQSGASGTLIFTSDLTSPDNGNKTLTLQGSTAGVGEFRGKIVDKSSGQTTAVAKSGTGTWILSGANTYSGGTTVNGGTLLVNNTTGSGTGTGAVTVNNSGTILGGTGTISGNVTVNGNASIQGGNGTTGTALNVGGNLTLADNSIIRLALGPSLTHSTLTRTGGSWTFDSNQAFTFINLGATTGTYQNIITGLASDPGTESGWIITGGGGIAGTFVYDGTGNIDLTLTAVPEPSTWIIGTLAFGVLGWTQRRRLRALLAR
jgi:autotransporter-associated beta strand protein